jgi:starch synthase
MEIIHLSAECYPIAKAGGLGDVVGALPQYQNKLGHIAKVVMPRYNTRFVHENEWELVHQGGLNMGPHWFHYNIIKEKTNKLGYDLYLVDVPGLLDRERIYSYDDDTERFLAFQVATLDWINSWQHRPDVIHCHDHHTALVPFMMQHCFQFREKLGNIASVLTIHNAQYQGWIGWDRVNLLPAFDDWKWGLLDWEKTINPLASGIRCAWKVTTVSPSYLEELFYMANGLEKLFEYERGKCSGILNGIDTIVWNPETDTYIDAHYTHETAAEGKLLNKQALCESFGLDETKPLVVFIGRLVGEKAADLLPEAIRQSVQQTEGRVSFLILGSGDPNVEWQLESLKSHLSGFYNCYIGYSEKLSHQIYAGADFLLMPSRVEPCGLNQLYALRYGTIPMVRSVGGLKDTVIDFGEPDGYGIRFNQASVWDITYSTGRALELFNDTEKYHALQQQIMQMDFSWDKSAAEYVHLYQSIQY